MKKVFRFLRLCDDVLIEPEKYAPVEQSNTENDSFRMIEIKTMPGGHISAQAVIVQKSFNS